MVLMGYSGARGTLIYEKNLKAKISCQTPFNLWWRFACSEYTPWSVKGIVYGYGQFIALCVKKY
jgi:hypothetical protein